MPWASGTRYVPRRGSETRPWCVPYYSLQNRLIQLTPTTSRYSSSIKKISSGTEFNTRLFAISSLYVRPVLPSFRPLAHTHTHALSADTRHPCPPSLHPPPFCSTCADWVARSLQDYDGAENDADGGLQYFRRRFVRLTQKANRMLERKAVPAPGPGERQRELPPQPFSTRQVYPQCVSRLPLISTSPSPVVFRLEIVIIISSKSNGSPG